MKAKVKQKSLNKYKVVVIEPQEKYGNEDSLTNDSNKRIVEFYGKEKGNFIASYYDTAILGIEDGRGLCLRLSEPYNSVSPEEMKELKEWLK